LLYYITDRTQFPGNEAQRRTSLIERVSEAAKCGIDFIQLREKDFSGRALEALATEAVHAARSSGGKTRLLINTRTDVAIAAGADGVHLQSLDILPDECRRIWRSAAVEREPVVAVSCHSDNEVARAAQEGAYFCVFGPVFEKSGAPAGPKEGLTLLRSVSRRKVPVLALGGVSVANAAQCLEAGASGIAGIRLFQHGDLAETVAKLRGLAAQLSEL
jgi:thiamine-phosphate pyrophosphorylase